MNPYDVLDRVPPCDIDTEACLCAACIIEPSNIDIATAIVTPEAFWDSATKRLFADLQILHHAGKPVCDAAVLIGELRSLGHLEEIGGVAFLYRILDGAHVHRPHATYYAKQIARLAELRRMVQIGSDMINDAYDLAGDPAQISASVQSRLLDTTIAGDDSDESISDVAPRVLDEIQQPVEQMRGIFSGVQAYDENIGPILSGELFVLAARPSMGKTALAMQIALHQAQRDRSVLFVSLEMKKPELVQRLACSIALVDGVVVRSRKTNVRELNRLRGAVESFGPDSRLRLWAPRRRHNMQLACIAARARMVRMRHGLDMLIVDYLQLIQPDDPRQNRQEQVAAISRGLKQIAGELDIPVVALCQFKRIEEDGRKPRLTDLRESGQIEQDADTVLMIHRASLKATKAFLIVGKHRFAPTGDIEVRWDPASQRFESDVAGEAADRQQFVQFSGDGQDF